MPLDEEYDNLGLEVQDFRREGNYLGLWRRIRRYLHVERLPRPDTGWHSHLKRSAARALDLHGRARPSPRRTRHSHELMPRHRLRHRLCRLRRRRLRLHNRLLVLLRLRPVPRRLLLWLPIPRRLLLWLPIPRRGPARLRRIGRRRRACRRRLHHLPLHHRLRAVPRRR